MSEPALLGSPGPAPTVSATWHPAACHLPELSALQVTLAHSGNCVEVDLTEICVSVI